jgi:hypothetical protein
VNRVKDTDHFSPDFTVGLVNMAGSFITAAEKFSALPATHLSENHFSLDNGHDEASMDDVCSSVHHKDVSGMDEPAQSALLISLEEERRNRVVDDQLIQGEATAPEVSAGCRETRVSLERLGMLVELVVIHCFDAHDC